MAMATFDEIKMQYHTALVAQTTSFKEMEAAKIAVERTGFQAEMSIISKVGGGDPKKVGPTEADRQRAYALGKANSPHALALQDYNSARADYKHHQGMVRLHELHLQFLIATAK